MTDIRPTAVLTVVLPAAVRAGRICLLSGLPLSAAVDTLVRGLLPPLQVRKNSPGKLPEPHETGSERRTP